jgi:hypothetical protein
MAVNEGGNHMGDDVSRQEFEGLTNRVSALERLLAVTDNEIKHIRDDIAWIRRGITTMTGLMVTAVVGAVLKLVLKI